MKKLSITLALSILSLASYAQKAEDYSFPVDKYDFGALLEGDAAAHEFEFTNKGSDTIRLDGADVRASCGCTTPDWTKSPIAPGQKGIIKAMYNTQGRPGPFQKSITVMNKGNVMKVLSIKGVVFPKDTTKHTKEQLDKSAHLSIEGKAEYAYGKIERNQKVIHDFKIKNTGKSTLEIYRSQSGCNCVTYRVLDKKGGAVIDKLEPGKSAVLEITYGPYTDGDNTDNIILITNDVNNPYTVIKVSGTVVETIQPKSPIIEDKNAAPFGK
jgi:hypothetical protein